MVISAHNVFCLVANVRITCIITGDTVNVVPGSIIHAWNQLMDDHLSNVAPEQVMYRLAEPHISRNIQLDLSFYRS